MRTRRCGKAANRTAAHERALFDLLLASAPVGGIGYDVIAEKLGIGRDDVRIMVYRLRQRGMRIETYFVALARGEFK